MKGVLHKTKNGNWIVKYDDIEPSSAYPILHKELMVYPISSDLELEEGKEVEFEKFGLNASCDQSVVTWFASIIDGKGSLFQNDKFTYTINDMFKDLEDGGIIKKGSLVTNVKPDEDSVITTMKYDSLNKVIKTQEHEDEFAAKFKALDNDMQTIEFMRLKRNYDALNSTCNQFTEHIESLMKERTSASWESFIEALLEEYPLVKNHGASLSISNIRNISKRFEAPIKKKL